MSKLALNDVVRRIVSVALASSVGAAGYACSSSNAPGNAAVPSLDAGGSGAAPDAEAGPFDDEATFACEAPLPSILDGLTLPSAVEYLELRDQEWTYGNDGGGSGQPTANATHGTPCATASNHDACVAALAAVALETNNDGWYTDGDNEGVRAPGFPTTKQFIVYTRGDQVGALRSPAEVAAFLGSIESLEEARLVLQAMNQPLVCSTAPRKSGWRKNEDGSWELLIVGHKCGTLIEYRKRYRVSKDGAVTLVANDSANAICGRRPDGLRDHHTSASLTSLAAHFANAAHLEAASVIAFRRLELELRRFGAPSSFARRAQRARADEINHARDTARLARRFGATVSAVDIAPMGPRDLVAFALENAVEGAVRETYGALVAAFQAERASPELRPLLRRIARDEARHAELAHDIDRWVQPKLSADERALIAAARAEALADLRAASAFEPDESVARIAGVPTAAEARILLDGLDREILAAA